MLYENVAKHVISIRLNECYTAIAMIGWNNDENKQTYSLYLKRDDIGLLDVMEEFKDVLIESQMETRLYVAGMVNKLNDDNVFDYYIERYETMVNAFDIGIEIVNDIL